jgi:hypothetical protein
LTHSTEFNICRRDHRDKQDVYDYGAILLEIVLGRPPTIRNPFPQKRSELVMKFYTARSVQLLFIYSLSGCKVHIALMRDWN